ncbi:hypothetical protein [Caldalkalibacillus mannanilyticus]|uniref:hypothetical protein n=1 Tax=Caldalkalibacillus mannanilyticus TaxID=1418 RepID=UPI00046AEB1B|nr:hypothetical protein [Caldalkalibacillus mannanilyticus]
MNSNLTHSLGVSFSPTTSQAPGVKLPFLFILAGVSMYLLTQLFLLIYGSQLVEGLYRTPAIWAIAHLLIIGWATMVSMGAMYQMVPVAFQIKIFSERLGFIQFGVMLIGIVGITVGFFTFSKLWLTIAGPILVLGFLLFLLNMFLSLRQIQNWNIMTAMVSLSLACLALTILLGLLLMWQLVWGGLLSQYHLALLYSHITLGLVGWFSLLIFGFSYKMVPMFALAHGYSMELGVPVLLTFLSGMLGITTAYFISSPVLLLCGALLLHLAFLLFAYHIWIIMRKRMKRYPDLGFKYALAAILAVVLASLLFIIILGKYATYGTLVTTEMIALVYFFLLGWVSLSILGYLFKIVPFLWWTAKYSKEIGRSDVPTLKDMINERAGSWFFPGFILATLLVAAGIWFQSAVLFQTGQGLHTLGAIFYSWLIFSVFYK